jgi:hypothetical protein
VDLIPGEKYIYTNVTESELVVTFLRHSHESYTKQIEFEDGHTIWVVARQLRPVKVN